MERTNNVYASWQGVILLVVEPSFEGFKRLGDGAFVEYFHGKREEDQDVKVFALFGILLKKVSYSFFQPFRRSQRQILGQPARALVPWFLNRIAAAVSFEGSSHYLSFSLYFFFLFVSGVLCVLSIASRSRAIYFLWILYILLIYEGLTRVYIATPRRFSFLSI